MADLFTIPTKKSSYYAKKFLNIGTLKAKKENYFQAIENFNKCLCYADASSSEFSLALSSRSQVYRKISDVKSTLKEEKRAARAKKNAETDELDISPNFFKLSYPPNKTIPYIVNCLELRNDENFGRYITTSRDLLPGDILAIEEPFFKIVNEAATHFRCANCLKSILAELIPSDLSSSCKYLKFH